MNRKQSTLSIIFLVISMAASSAIFARGVGGFNNGGDRGLNNDYNNKGYDNSFYYNRHLNDYNGVAVIPDDADADSSCQTTQVCDSSGTCVTQQNCD